MPLKNIQPGKPDQNAYVESLDSRFRDKYLNENGLVSMAHAKAVIARGRREYNHERTEVITRRENAKRVSKAARPKERYS